MIRVKLREISKCNDSQIKEIMDVRNQLSVRKSMFTEHKISLKEHLAWVDRLIKDKKHLVFGVLIDNKIIGSVSINALDYLHLKSDWAFYLDENIRNGLGAAIEFNLIKFVFNELGLGKLNCEVIESNKAVIKLHKKFGFIEEGLRRKNIVKDKKRTGVVFLGLAKSDWNNFESKVFDKYKKVIEKFDIEIEYSRE